MKQSPFTFKRRLYLLVLLVLLSGLFQSACNQIAQYSVQDDRQAQKQSQDSDSDKPLAKASESRNLTEDIQQSQSLKPDSSEREALKPLDFNRISERCAERVKNVEFKRGEAGWQSLAEQAALAAPNERILSLYPVTSGQGAEQILSFSESGHLRLIDLLSGDMFSLFTTDIKFDEYALSPDFCFLAIAWRDNIQVYELGTGGLFSKTSRVVGVISALEFQPNGTGLLIGAANTNIYRWHFLPRERKSVLRATTSDLERYIAHPNVVSALAYHPDGRVFFSGDWSGLFNAWENYEVDPFDGAFDYEDDRRSTFIDAADRKKSALSPNDGVEHISVSDDGTLIAVGFQSGKVVLLKVRGLKPLMAQVLHKGALLSLDISRDGSKLITVGRDGFLRLWRLQVKAERSEILRQEVVEAEQLAELEANDIEVVRFINDRTFVAGVQSGQVYSVKMKAQLESQAPIEKK